MAGPHTRDTPPSSTPHPSGGSTSDPPSQSATMRDQSLAQAVARVSALRAQLDETFESDVVPGMSDRFNAFFTFLMTGQKPPQRDPAEEFLEAACMSMERLER